MVLRQEISAVQKNVVVVIVRIGQGKEYRQLIPHDRLQRFHDIHIDLRSIFRIALRWKKIEDYIW